MCQKLKLVIFVIKYTFLIYYLKIIFKSLLILLSLMNSNNDENVRLTNFQNLLNEFLYRNNVSINNISEYLFSNSENYQNNVENNEELNNQDLNNSTYVRLHYNIYNYSIPLNIDDYLRLDRERETERETERERENDNNDRNRSFIFSTIYFMTPNNKKVLTDEEYTEAVTKLEHLEFEDECSICLNCINDTKINKCSHKFCENCIKTWLTKSKSNCPTCRIEIKN